MIRRLYRVQVRFAARNSDYTEEREVLFVFAVFETGGKQYKVSEGDVVKIERLAVKDGETVTFTKVLAIGGETLSVGAPYVDGASVKAEVLAAEQKDRKIYVFKYKAKKNEKKKIGHRQLFTKIKITSITA